MRPYDESERDNLLKVISILLVLLMTIISDGVEMRIGWRPPVTVESREDSESGGRAWSRVVTLIKYE